MRKGVTFIKMSPVVVRLVDQAANLNDAIITAMQSADLAKDDNADGFTATQFDVQTLIARFRKDGIPQEFEHDLGDFERLCSYEAEFADLLQKMSGAGRLTKLLSSNRLRKRIDELNLQVTFIVQRMAAASGCTVADLRRESQMTTKASKVHFSDPEGQKFWNESFGAESDIVEWNKFVRGLEKWLHIVIPLPREILLKKLLDTTQVGVIGPYRFSQFLKGFGSLRTCLDQMDKILKEPWFHSFISRSEAQKLLAEEPVGTFLVRFSKSHAGAFAVAFTMDDGKVMHTIVEGELPAHVKIKEQGGKHRFFASLYEVLDEYKDYLKSPLMTTLTHEPWFHGDLTEEDAEQVLHGRPAGTYMIRMTDSSKFALSYLRATDKGIKCVHVPITRTGRRNADLKTVHVYKPDPKSGMTEFTDFNVWLKANRVLLKYNYDRSGTPDLKVKVSKLSKSPLLVAEGPKDPMKPDDADPAKPAFFYGISASGYPESNGGWQPICDSFKMELFHEWSILALADGCNWGFRPQKAALIARNAFLEFVKAHQHEFSTTSEVAYLLMKAFSIAHEKIIEGKNADEIWECGTTTLLGGVVLPLDEGRGRDDPRWGFVVASVGDCKAYVYSHKKKMLHEATMGNRGGLDATDPGGRLGPFVNEGAPDLRNFRSYFCYCEKGDSVIIASDGVHDNLDCLSLGKKPADLGLKAATWKELPEKEVEHRKDEWSLTFGASLFTNCKTPRDLVTVLIDHSLKTTQSSRDFMLNHPTERLPNNYELYPGKMDHSTALACRVGKVNIRSK